MDSLEKSLCKLKLTQRTSRQVHSQNNYRNVSIYPNATELVHARQNQLRPNITKGPYDSMEHYLNTHFSLLREDFLKPIRENLRQFLNDPSQKLLNIKIHEVQFIRKGVKDSNVCHCLEIKRGITYHSWNIKRDAKRFMLGSLLIFSKDRQFKTIFCGKVADTQSLLFRKMLVSFESPVDLKYETNYTMIECNTFFEPYYHVLKAIQGLPLDNFPMKQYLVETNTTVEMPKYLKGVKYSISESKLNRSQLVAMNGALSQELVIIQGPPGTGKTFLGLKIAKELLSISKKWCVDDTPMLVISFTNHALDQFLEGLTDATDKILRFGAQSKNPKMKHYTVRECRQRFYDSTITGRLGKAQMAPIYKEYRGIELKIRGMGNQMDNIATSKPTCVFYFDKLAEGVPEVRRWFSNGNHARMVSWLLVDDGTMWEQSSPVDSSVNDAQLMIAVYTDYLKDAHKGSKYCMLSLSIMNNAVQKLYDKIIEISKGIEKKKQKYAGVDKIELYIREKKREVKKLTGVYSYLLKKIDYFKICLRKDFGNQVDRSKVWQANPFKMPVRVRWQLYQYWLGKYEVYMKVKMDDMIEEYKPVFKEFSAIQEQNNLSVMRHQKIIGMTTTMAARMHTTIKALKCPIVIVEEAAEVLEAHIIPVLTEHCQHLILIGDHQQLKPTTADYDIETRYKLGVSLFERMVRNDIQCFTLNVQHRMRPEISSLVTPSIYPVLHNHESVTGFEPIRGMDKCLYFLTHRQPEEGAGDSSKKNLHEAKFMIELAVYLLKNNYKPEEITILAAYLGQVGALLQEQRQHREDSVKNVKITSVDNFQGEENKIILLSLVRNNNYKKIGFLSIENRVCVALSRAKEGMYVMGNMRQLEECSQLWQKINITLEDQNSIGTSLPLKCQQHGVISQIKSPEEFDVLVPNGGCVQVCEAKLRCGHVCKIQCHNDDPKHQKVNCMQPCIKKVCHNPGHKCIKLCYQTCGNCMHKLTHKLPCGHHVRCFMTELEDYRCVEKVYIRMNCGHKRSIECNDVDSDFEEDVDCVACKSLSSSSTMDKKDITRDSVLEEIEDCVGKLNLGDSDDSDSELELPEKPEDQDVRGQTSFKGFKNGIEVIGHQSSRRNSPQRWERHNGVSSLNESSSKDPSKEDSDDSSSEELTKLYLRKIGGIRK